MQRTNRMDTKYHPIRSTRAKRNTSATNCPYQPVLGYAGKAVRPIEAERPCSNERKIFQPKRSMKLVLKWYQNISQQVPCGAPPTPPGRPNRIAGLPNRLDGSAGMVGTQVRRPTNVCAGMPSTTWLSFPKKQSSPIIVLHGIRYLPWSTSTLVSVFPDAKNEFLPISTVSGSKVCSAMVLSLPILAPHKPRYHPCIEASPKFAEALVAMNIFMEATAARQDQMGTSNGVETHGKSRQTSTGPIN
mmetsp:Transcript_23795/g.67383  ORF Transcript_23795/g.67383 Transcript_23795/m.67383 type:complete len:245 (-) Transcript_23795:875-1609(-)